jgi:hypothetical protein
MPAMPVQAKYDSRWAITIPASGGTPATIRNLLRAAGYQGEVAGVIISPWLAGTANAGTQRPSFMAATPRGASLAQVATDFTTHGEYVAPGQLYYVPAEDDDNQTYVQAVANATITALCIVLI